MFKFAAFTLMRPGEVYALEWSDINFKTSRIQKARRVYEGTLAEPKTGPKEIALTPPARDALMALDRDGPLVFPAKRGGMISASGMSGYWGKVLAAAGLDFEFYLASKHYGVWFMWTQLGMSNRAIAAQAGWSLRTVDKMLGPTATARSARSMRSMPLSPLISRTCELSAGLGDAIVTQRRR